MEQRGSRMVGGDPGPVGVGDLVVDPGERGRARCSVCRMRTSDDDAEIIHVRRQVKKVGAKLVFALPKGQKTRTVPASAHVRKRLREHVGAFSPVAVTLPWGGSG
ncbi:hypothetical protein [Streptomyces sp. NPDC007063]|uniref:hypothetical protein n=1 Tax=Streptomyces sp. NPDC007063 TaxID=3364772 RepID=UPI0036B4DB84